MLEQIVEKPYPWPHRRLQERRTLWTGERQFAARGWGEGRACAH
jgi:hypothetical protein